MDADAESDKVEDCDTDATANQYVFQHIRSAKKYSTASKHRLISNKLGPDQTNSAANYDDHFSNYCDNNIDDIVDIETEKQIKATETATQLNLHFLWIFLRDLLTSIVNTNDNIDNNNNNDTNENTDINFELNASSSECDYNDESNSFTIIDGGDLKADVYSQKHKFLRQKLLGNFYGIF